VSFSIGLPNFVKIELPLAELWRHIDFFPDGSRQPYWIWITLDHYEVQLLVSARSSILVLIEFIFSEILRFLYFDVLCHFGEGRFGDIFPQMTSPVDLTHKKHFLTRKHAVLAIKRKNRFNVSTWARSWEKGQDSKKSQSGNISSILVKAPTVPIKIKICIVGNLRDLITCENFQVWIYRGYDFTMCRISHFPIDFCVGLTTVQRYCAACDIITPTPLTISDKGIVLNGRPADRSSVNSYFEWFGTFVLRVLILMKLVTNVCHVSGNCWRGYRGQRWKVKVVCVNVSAITAMACVSTVWLRGLLVWICNRDPVFMTSGIQLARCVTFIPVCNQPPRLTQPGHSFAARRNKYLPKGGDALRLGNTDKKWYVYGVAGKTVIPLMLHTDHVWAVHSCPA